MGVREIDRFLQKWQMEVKDLRRRMILAPTPRERGAVVRRVAAGPGVDGICEGGGAGTRPPHHRAVGCRLRRGRACSLDIRADRGFPPALDETQQEELKAAVQELPASSGIGLANWNWRVVHRFVWERFGLSLCRSNCLNYLHYLHWLGFAFKRAKKRLVKADQARREAFVAEYAALREESIRTGAKIFFADEAHFRADAELRGKWALKGEPALVDLSSPRRGEKASYYSAVCLETGEVEWMELDGNSNSESSVAFLSQLREGHLGPLKVNWDNAPAHRGEALREYLRTPGLGLGLVNLPGYSPDFNADEAVWGWARQEATGNLCQVHLNPAGGAGGRYPANRPLPGWS